jgi:hypothetical protein
MALVDKEKDIQDDIIDIKIEGTKRQRFRLNGDPKSIIELNISDIGIVNRLETGVAKLTEEMSAISKLDDDENLIDALKQADKSMREYVDYIFDSPVSEVCAKYGTMYDPFNGKFRWEHIVESLLKLYENNISEEYKKIRTRINKHTEKYTMSTRKKSRK